jgi:hypothetical protein
VIVKSIAEDLGIKPRVEFAFVIKLPVGCGGLQIGRLQAGSGPGFGVEGLHGLAGCRA